MVKDLLWLVKLQKVDSLAYESKRELSKTEARIGRLKFEIDENSVFIIKEQRKKTDLAKEKDETEEGIVDQERLLNQKKEDLQNDKKTKKEHIKREVLKLEQAVKIFTKKVKDLEKEMKEITTSVKNREDKINELEEILKSEESKLNKIISEHNKINKSIEGEKDEVMKNIRPQFLSHYERILKLRNGIAVTYVTDDGLCNGCKVHIPITSRQKIALMDDYNICEGCGRVLVTKEALNED
ncbi:MAG: hypothetical protein JXR48_15150 [Candidatus Delongbacteria bacterium]|nr:hypothetical protein [Candidatus Delongbacteria bacterium]MBN2836294.1 hypothetical protein [Candidatus Delongbacteria bacterium]